MRFRNLAPWLWLAPAGGLLIPFFVIPLLMLIGNSFLYDEPEGTVGSGLTWLNYIKVLSDPYYLKVFGNTFVSAIGIALLALVLAYPFAWLLAHASGKARTFLIWIIYLPIYTSVIMRVFGWLVILADSGIANQTLTALGLIDAPIRMMGETGGMAIGLLHRYLPLMIIPLATSLGKVDFDLLRASANLGGSPSRTWIRVILPISMPGAVAGTQLVFSAVLSDFVIPVMLGTTRFPLLAPTVYYEATTNASWPVAGAMGTVVLLIVVVVLLITNLIVRRLAPWSAI
jgi:ABC-type spermidine/putrescine transport system permease subunit I